MQIFFHKEINNPDASIGVCCSHKVIALGFNTLCYDAERRGIKPSARINIGQQRLNSTLTVSLYMNSIRSIREAKLMCLPNKN